jgi:NAD-dependent glycerol-3-phosphate dehydrogenase C-terminus/Predicted nucleotide-binding protein containing TIR-like domain
LQFRIYISTDLIGAELGGAMKNVCAIAMGIFDGYFDAKHAQGVYLGDDQTRQSFRGPLLSLCNSEFVRFGLSQGAKMSTLLGPSGIGDLTSSSHPASRNYRTGHALALLDMQRSLEKTADTTEGYETLEAAVRLAASGGLDMPILRATYEILSSSGNLERIVNNLILSLSGAIDSEEEEKSYYAAFRIPRQTGGKRAKEIDPRKVFVVHGRNHKIRDSMYAFLSSVGLVPLEWNQVVEATGSTNPYIGQILARSHCGLRHWSPASHSPSSTAIFAAETA